MFGMNDVVLSGVLAREGELRYTPEGNAILLCSLAGTGLALRSNGEVRNVPFALPVKVFGSRAEDLALLERGRGLLVHGSLCYSSWQADTREKRSRLEVLARTVFEVEASTASEDASSVRQAPAGINHAIIGGNLTRDPQLRSTGDGTSILSLTLAVHERIKRHGQVGEQTHFVEVVLWGALADAHAHLTKGAGVLVIGRLFNDVWIDREGQRRHVLKLEGSHLEVVAKKPPLRLGALNPNAVSSPTADGVSADTAMHSSRSGFLTGLTRRWR